nr:multidrug resistance-associated protein 5 [Tanacetum cinerariifolium]
MVVSLPFTVNLYHDGLFQVNPLEYVHFDSRVIGDVSFDDIHCFEIAKNDEDHSQFVKACYENNLKINLFTEHNGYDIMEMIHEDLHPKKPISHVDLDSNGETNVPLDDVAHVVKQLELKNEGRFLLEVEDPDDEQVESKFKAKQDVSYHSFNPNTPWNECKPVLGMRDVSEGMCASLEAKKPKTFDDDECETSKQGSKKGNGKKVVNETLSKAVKEIWNKKKETEKKGFLNKVTVPIDVSLGQCERANQCALFDHEGGLVDQYSKLWQYRQAILDINPGSTCVLENEVNDEDGKLYFSMFYVCFHGVKQGWLEAVVDCLPNAEHKQCAKHIMPISKRDGVGYSLRGFFRVLLQHLWSQSFCKKKEEIKILGENAHEWLVERNPNSWCRAYSKMDRYSAAFENGILESFNSRIVVTRGKPIITMLEDIRVYIMQRMFCMNKLAFDNKDSITPSVRRQMEYNKMI